MKARACDSLLDGRRALGRVVSLSETGPKPFDCGKDGLPEGGRRTNRLEGDPLDLGGAVFGKALQGPVSRTPADA